MSSNPYVFSERASSPRRCAGHTEYKLSSFET